MTQSSAVRVLVVDDDLEILHSTVYLLRHMGYEVRFAINGYAALEIAQLFCPEVVLLDLGLPGLHGCEVARRLRQDPATRTTKIFAVTGHNQEDDRRRSIEAGCDEHLRKPLEPAFFDRLTKTGS